MRQVWTPEELVECWTLLEGDWPLLGNKSGATRLGFAVLLKFFELEGRFPAYPQEVPLPAVEYLAGLVKVEPVLFSKYSWSGRSIEYHRAQIRRVLGFRESTRQDEEALTVWLAAEVCGVELVQERLVQALLVRCRAERIEPPGRVERIVAAAQARFDARFCAATVTRLGSAACTRLERLVQARPQDEEADSPDSPDSHGSRLLALLKADPGALSLDAILTETAKLQAVRSLGLPEGLFADASERLVAAWRSRAVKMYPSDFRDVPDTGVRVTLLAALCASRQSEITDALVELLIGLVHKINARAEKKVERELTADLRRVRGKESILFRMAEAALERPEETVRKALYPVVAEKTLRELVAEAKANEKIFAAQVRISLRHSYSNHYRRMLPPLLATLSFRCNNSAYRPVMDALDVLARYATADEALAPNGSRPRWYAAGDVIPLEGVVPVAWRAAVVDEKGRIERIPYELCVLVALREALRRREVYVEGAARWRNPEEDLPGDFEATRDVHYAAIRAPLDAGDFVAGLQERLRAGLQRLDAALAGDTAGGVKITVRHGEPWIGVPKLEALDPPRMLTAVKEPLGFLRQGMREPHAERPAENLGRAFYMI